MEDIEIIKVVDINLIKDLFKKQVEYHKKLSEEDFETVEDYLEKAMEFYKDKKVYAAVKNGEVIGFIIFDYVKNFLPPYFKNKDVVLVYELFVEEKFRRKGIGTLLLNLAIDFAKEKDIKAVVLYVHCKNKGAIQFYKKRKFKGKFIEMRRYLD